MSDFNLHVLRYTIEFITIYTKQKYPGDGYKAITRYFKSGRCTFKLSIIHTGVDDSRQMYFFDRKDKGCPILGEYMTHLRKHST